MFRLRKEGYLSLSFAGSERTLRFLPGLLCFICWIKISIQTSLVPSNQMTQSLASLFIFILLPIAIGFLIRARSMSAFPLLVVKLFFGLMFLNTAIGSQIDELEDLALAGLVIMSGAGNGAYLFSRGFAQVFLRDGIKMRKEQRQRVDALVRVRIETSEKETKFICVVIRDISSSGIGIYGFPDDITMLITAFKNESQPKLNLVYREKTYVLDVDCRWRKESPEKGECGLQIEPSSSIEALQKVLLLDSGAMQNKPFFIQLDESKKSFLFSTSMWVFSMASLLLIAIN